MHKQHLAYALLVWSGDDIQEKKSILVTITTGISGNYTRRIHKIAILLHSEQNAVLPMHDNLNNYLGNRLK